MSLFSWICPGVPSGTREIDHTFHRERGRCTSRQSTRRLEIAYDSAESWPYGVLARGITGRPLQKFSLFGCVGAASQKLRNRGHAVTRRTKLRCSPKRGYRLNIMEAFAHQQSGQPRVEIGARLCPLPITKVVLYKPSPGRGEELASSQASLRQQTIPHRASAIERTNAAARPRPKRRWQRQPKRAAPAMQP